jgi:hypothetical protein
MNFPPQYERIFNRLDQEKLREVNGVWYVRCPAHEDFTPSMTLRVGDTGCLLIKCHRNNGNGCHLGDILAALDCTTADIFPPKEGVEKRYSAKNEATWDYRDEAGRLSFQVVRYRAEDGSKRYLQRRPNPDSSSPDAFIMGLGDTKRTLYRLPQLLEYIESERRIGSIPPIWVVEGERCADAITRLGFQGTTNSGGCGRFAMTDYSPLSFCNVVVLPDNDARDEKLYRTQGRESWAGQSHAEEVCRLLFPIAATVKYVDLPGSPIKGDIADWMNARRSSGINLHDMRGEFLSVVARTPFWVPPAQPHPLFAAAETLSRRESPLSLKKWQRTVEEVAGDIAGCKDPKRLVEYTQRLAAVLVAGSEAFLGIRRPPRSLPIQETADEVPPPTEVATFT